MDVRPGDVDSRVDPDTDGPFNDLPVVKLDSPSADVAVAGSRNRRRR